MNRTKIVATIGPASADRSVLRQLIESGLSVARLNFSHGSHREHRQRYDTLRELAEEVGRPLAILQDLTGPKIRVGRFADGGSIQLLESAEVTVTTRDVVGRAQLIPTSYSGLPGDVRPGDHILLHDGLIDLEVLSKTDRDVRCRVVFGGTLSDRQGINLPGSETSEKALTEKDRDDLAFGLDMGVDFVALSFVRRADDIAEVKQLIAARGHHTPVIAKIEKPQAVSNVADILAAADGVMIARGDLGVELPLEQVPIVQKDLIARANAAGKPVITATQMLESMCTSPRPTRAEVSDVANAILDGTDAVMLSGESAAGQFPVQSVATMRRIADAAEERLSFYRVPRGEPTRAASFSEAAADAACEAAEDLRAGAIVVFTESGTAARLIAQRRPRARILALTPSERTRRALCLVWGVHPVLLPKADEVEQMLAHGLATLRGQGLLAPGDVLVALAGTALSAGSSNLVRILRVGDVP